MFRLNGASSLVLLVCLAILSVVSAAPTKSLQKRTFRVNRYQHSTGSRSASKAMRNAYNKWGLALPKALVSTTQSSLTNVNAVNDTGVAGEVVNEPEEHDIEYLSPVTIGGQKLVMNFDTGSSDLWVFSSLLPANAKAGHDVFDPTKSPTFKQIPGASYRISFGDGSSSAGNVVGTDTVDIGGATVTGQAVELATAVSSSFVADQASDGIVGLAFGKINTVQPNRQKTFFENIMSDLKEPVFAAQLKKAEKGFYEFGQVDTTAFKGELHKVPVNTSAGFWQIESAYFQVGDGPVFHNPVASPAIADTGTTLLLVDDIVAEKYYEQVPGATFNQNSAMWVFPCNAQLPDFKLGLGADYRATIDGSLLKFQEVTLSAGGVRSGGETQTVCIGAMQGNGNQGLQIFGDVLFKAQFTVFDIGAKTIGFADHA